MNPIEISVKQKIRFFEEAKGILYLQINFDFEEMRYMLLPSMHMFLCNLDITNYFELAPLDYIRRKL